MGEDINSKIQQMAELLGHDKMPDNVKDLLSVLASSLGGNQGSSDGSDDSSQSNNPNRDSDQTINSEQLDQSHQAVGLSNEFRSEPEINLGQSTNSGKDLNIDDLTSRLQRALSSIGNVNDPRISLLLAVKPFMNGNRQKKIGNCIQLLQFTGLTRMLNNQDK